MSPFPSNAESQVLKSVIKYLDGIKNRGDEDQQEQMGIAIECLQQVVSISDIPSNTADLAELVANASIKISEKSDSPAKEPPALSFRAFVQRVTDAGFFKENEKGSVEYQNLLEKARGKYCSRFPGADIKPIDLRPLAERQAAAEKHKARGNELLKSGDFDGAIAAYGEAIHADWDNAVYYSNRAAAYTHCKKYDMAIEDAKEAIELRPEWIKAYTRLGHAQFSKGDYEAALETYESALSKTKASDPQWSQIMDNIDKCKERTGAVSRGGGGGGMPGMGGFPGMGGGGFPAGMEGLGEMMKNPMMQQMAQKMMQDPNMMQNMQKMMGNMFGGGGGAGRGMPDPGKMQKLMAVMKDENKRKEILAKVANDPDVDNLSPDLKDAIDNAKMGDMSKFQGLAMSNPACLAELSGILGKYI